MQGLTLRGTLLSIEPDFVFDAEHTPIVWTVKTNAKKTDKYNNDRYECELQILGKKIKTISVKDRRIAGFSSENGSGIMVYGKDDEFIKLCAAISDALEAQTSMLVSQGKLGRAYISPYKMSGALYEKRNAKHKAELAKKNEPETDVGPMECFFTTVYPLGDKGNNAVVKCSIKAQEGNKITTNVRNNGSGKLDSDTVLGYNLLVKQFSKPGASDADRLYNSKFFEKAYSKPEWDKIVAYAKNADDAGLSRYEALPTMGELKTICKGKIAKYMAISVPTYIGDSQKNANSLGCKFITNTLSMAPGGNQQEQDLNDDYEAYLAGLNEEPQQQPQTPIIEEDAPPTWD